MKTSPRLFSRLFLFAVVAAALTVASANAADSSDSDMNAAAAGSGKAAVYPSDAGRLDGDHLTLRTNVEGFQEAFGQNTDLKCAPAGSLLSVTSESGDQVLVRFRVIPNENDTDVRAYSKDSSYSFEKVTKLKSLESCKEDRRVNGYTQYKIPKATLQRFDYRRSGAVFGGLVVPFKFRLGGAKELSSSSTVAPYVGFRSSLLQGWGLTFTPVFSAGLGMVPVVDPTNNTTTTKAAFSTAVGLVLTSNKNEGFNAGFLIGRDFLSRSDRQRDPDVNAPWVSLYLGYSL